MFSLPFEMVIGLFFVHASSNKFDSLLPLVCSEVISGFFKKIRKYSVDVNM